jgi:hypothetical protein
MTYDLIFARRRPGPPHTALDLTDGQRAAWDRVVTRVRATLGPVGVSRLPEHLEITQGALTLTYTGDSAVVAVPFGLGDDPIPALYAAGRIVAEETGLAGTDPQTGLSVADGDIERATAEYARRGGK